MPAAAFVPPAPAPALAASRSPFLSPVAVPSARLEPRARTGVTASALGAAAAAAASLVALSPPAAQPAVSTAFFDRFPPKPSRPAQKGPDAPAGPAEQKRSSAAAPVLVLPSKSMYATSPDRKPRKSTSFVTAAVRNVGAAVVRIDTERVIRGQTTLVLPHGISPDPLLDDPALKKFFGALGAEAAKNRVERGQGSGFIISEDGFLLTNAHVVKGAEKVTVTLSDGVSHVGIVKGTDDILDLAVIKIQTSNPQKFPVAPLGVSSELEIGEWAIAVGSPLNLQGSVTLGIISSLNRSSSEVGIPEKRLNLIQTSASLNPGSSGGPICNQWGEVVGISTAVRANAEAIGFAIPIDTAKEVAAELAKGNTISHAFLGIQMANLTPESAKQNNIDPNSLALVPEVEGALVARVVPMSPAAAGGVRRHDVIVSIDGKKVRNIREVQGIVAQSRVGQVLSMQVRRGEARDPIQLGVKTGDLASMKNPQAFQLPSAQLGDPTQ